MPWEKQFDQTDVLEKAQRAFWANGYDGTPMSDLLDQMGIQKGSFYATFGSKHDVFIASLEKYIDNRFSGFDSLLTAKSPKSALVDHICAIAADALSCNGSMGCFVANAAVEMAPKDADIRSLVCKTFDRHIGLYRRILDAAVANNELPDTYDSLLVARSLFALVIGMRIIARAGMPAAVIHSIRDQAISLINS
jgi:TetR/AcrR family transcriptional regulator, transcriptional repressor for nem operon